MFRILATMKHPKNGNKSFLLGLTLLLGAFLTIVCSYQASQSKDDFNACELAEYAFDAENSDSDDTHPGFAGIVPAVIHDCEQQSIAGTISQITGNSFVPVFSVSRRILYQQLQLNH